MDDQIAPSAPITLAAALLSDSLESCLKHLDSAQQFKASMALDPDFISPETERVGAAIQELYDLAEGSAAILIDTNCWTAPALDAGTEVRIMRG